MRFILISLVSILLFSSCASEKSIIKESFTPPYSYESVFSDGECEFEGIIFFDGKVMTFSANSPEGYVIRIGENGCEVEYEGMIFTENLLPSSRFLPLYEMIMNLEECEISKDPLVVKKDNITIKFEENK